MNPKQVGIVVAVVASALATHTAEAAPAWCKDLPEHSTILRDEVTEPMLEHALYGIAQQLCYPYDDKAVAARDALEARRQWWLQRLGMTEADWKTDAVPALAELRGHANADITPADSMAWSTMGPLEQFATLMNPSRSNWILQAGGREYMIDAMKPTASGRLAYVHGCLRLGRPSDGDRSDTPVMRWAVCQPDIDALDPKAITAELRTETARTPFERMLVRVALNEVLLALPVRAAKIKEVLAKEPGYAKLFAMAREARTQFTASPDLLALVSSLDDARITGSRKLSAGCSDKAWAAFTKEFAKLPAKRFTNLKLPDDVSPIDNAVGPILQTPDGYLATNALVACEGKHDALMHSLVSGLEYWWGYRGPRTAAFTALLVTPIELDNRASSVERPVPKLPLIIGDGWKNPSKDSVSGTVASIADKGEMIELRFPKKQAARSVCVEDRPTKRVSRIHGDGRLEYERECTKSVMRTFDSTLDPVEIPKRYAAGIKAGVYVDVQMGTVYAAWTKPGAPAPIAVFGVPLK